jgi:serine/threonine protein kinase
VTLVPGARLGTYEILSLLGTGGMGEVYRAHDRKLDRDVAIKMRSEALAADPDRIARFEREAKTLAALNQPHIAQIYGLEESNGVRALVMELVDGATLADRLAQGPIPIDEALPMAKQIAEALEAAHEQRLACLTLVTHFRDSLEDFIHRESPLHRVILLRIGSDYTQLSMIGISPQLFCTIIFATWSRAVLAEQHAGSCVITSRASLAIIFSAGTA